MDHILPIEILYKILLSVVNPQSLFINFSDERYKYTEEELVTRNDIDNLPMFEESWIGIEHELSFLTWPVDFHHNVSAYRVHQQHATTCISVCKTFEAILTPILYQCALLSTSFQAQALVATLGDAKLATLVKTVIICPRPLSYPNRALVNRVVNACPNLRAFHNYSIYHSLTYITRANMDDAILPLNMTRLTQDPFSIARVERQSALWNTLVFLELTSPACHWDHNLPVLQISLPNLVSLKMEQTVGMLTMLQGCSMPVLRYLCLTRLMRHADVGKASVAFLKKHGQRLIQLEYPDLLWGAGGGETTLDNVCPDLKVLIVDPMYCVAEELALDPPPMQGAPGHLGVSEIGLRHVASRVGRHTRIGNRIKTHFNSLINTEAFPMLDSVCDMAWNRDTRRVRADWMFITDLCEEKGVSFRDWAGNIVV